MKIICLTVGKKHDAIFESAITNYMKRLRPYVDFDFEYISSSNIAAESDSIMKQLKVTDRVILLDETGDSVDNQALADQLHLLQVSSVKRLVFIIGGSYGVTETVKDRSDKVLSLSKLVFPHQLVRLLLVEQLYRSFNLLSGGKYHHD